MNVTDKEIKYRQLQWAFDEVLEGYPQIVSAEQKGYVGVCASSRITENNIITTDMSKEGLLEQMLDKDNLNDAFNLKDNKVNLIQSIREGKWWN